MHSAKILGAIAVLLAIIIGTGIFSMRTIADTSKTLEDYVVSLENYSKLGEWEKAAQVLSDMENDWDKTEKTWTMLIDHFEIDNIDNTIKRAGKYIDARDSSSAMAEIASLKQYIKHIPEKEAFKLKNIL